VNIMTREELLTHLSELHEELSAADETDQETRDALQQLTTDVDRLLSEPVDTAEAVPSSENTSPGERLRDLAREFDVRYPHIADLIERVSDGLASMGI